MAAYYVVCSGGWDADGNSVYCEAGEAYENLSAMRAAGWTDIEDDREEGKEDGALFWTHVGHCPEHKEPKPVHGGSLWE